MIKCLECGKEFKSQLTSHLPVHELNKESYKEKFPGAETISPEMIDKFKGRKAWSKGLTSEDDPRILGGEDHPMHGREQTDESKRKSSETHIRLYQEDPGYRERVSEGTKKGMRKPESWKKYRDSVDNRDCSGEKNSFYGKHHSEETKRKISENTERAQKISDKINEWWSTRKGKTVEEIYGEKRGAEIREIRKSHNGGEKNPAYGKVYENTGKKVGKYKGLLFRGIWELSFLKKLEKEGIGILDETQLKYEFIKIPYKMSKKSRNYFVDYYFPKQKKLVEIKSEWTLNNSENKEMNVLKKLAAEKYCEERGWTYQILTEKDFHIMTYAQAYADPDIEWIRR